MRHQCRHTMRRLRSERHQSSTLFGTPLYIAPELIKSRTYTQASDMWALGCTIVELASGKNPWEVAIMPGATATVLRTVHALHAVFTNPGYDPAAVVPAHLTSQLRELLCRMLQLDPSKRPTATECLQELNSMAQSPCFVEPVEDYVRLLDVARCPPKHQVEGYMIGITNVRTSFLGSEYDTGEHYLESTEPNDPHSGANSPQLITTQRNQTLPRWLHLR